MGPLPLPSSEILAWAQLYDISLLPEEAQMLRRMDMAYLTAYAEHK